MTGQRVAVVTGGTRGIGRAISERLTADGLLVVAVYAADEVAAKSLQEDLPSVTVEQADVSEPSQCHALVASVLDRHGRLDCVINNAGIVMESKLRDVTTEEWTRQLQVNLSASFYLTQAAMPAVQSSDAGRVVNVGSITASMGSPVQIAYGAAKAGLIGLTRSLARSVARSGVTVNCVVPGSFDTDLPKGLTYTDPQKVTGLIPLGRWGRAEELAHAVAFLVDERASYITGSVLTVDGGMSMGG
jgi:acetoacetyl-CoA reductase/3-oxoacyl-[acyl-carrier protein] reductase